MEEAEKQDSVPEVVSPTADAQETAPQQVAAQPIVQDDDSDWIKNLRRDRKEAIRRAEDAENRAKMQEELLQRVMAQQYPSQSAPIEPDIIQEIEREEYVPGEKVARALKKQKEDFRKELDEVKKTYAAQHQQNLFSDLKREYADFDEVVTSETLAILEETNPKLAHAIAASKDPYSIAIQSYEYIKAKGLTNKLQSKRMQETDSRIEQNKTTIQSPQAFDKRPIAQAFKMTDDMKKDLYREMTGYAQQAGMGY